ncbi:MAG: class I SAM-dependent methyltransferase [Candidatus Margulisiibacteriota bacterium]
MNNLISLARVIQKKLLRSVAKSAVFPVSRWYRANLFLWHRKLAGQPLEAPSFAWLIFGRLYFYIYRNIEQLQCYYYDAVISNYSKLIKKHYYENYAFCEVSYSSQPFLEKFSQHPGSISELFDNQVFSDVLAFKPDESFLDCGCGPGGNIKLIKARLPNALVRAFDLSPNAVNFAQEYFKGQNVEVFQGSVLDLRVFEDMPDNSIDNVLFSHMFSTLYINNIEETRHIRQMILDQAVRIAKKNVILKEAMSPTIYIEQKYRAIFQEDYSLYFEKHGKAGDVVLGKDLLFFHKREHV